MSKPFRWKGPGVFTDLINGKAFQAGEGDKVLEHTVHPKKLEGWVKDGTAEYLNIAENVAGRIKGGKPDDEETKRLQAAHDQTNAVLRIKVLGELRLLIADRVFNDVERSEFEAAQATMSTDDLTRALESTQAEHKRRLNVIAAAEPSTPAQPESTETGAEAGETAETSSDPSEEDMERLTDPDAEPAGSDADGEGAGPR